MVRRGLGLYKEKSVYLDLLCNPLVATNNAKPSIAKAKQLVFKTCHAP